MAGAPSNDWLPEIEKSDQTHLQTREFLFADYMNPQRLMWANDFPHSDSTWPWSQELLAEHSKHLSAEERAWILRDNCAELYKIDVVR